MRQAMWLVSAAVGAGLVMAPAAAQEDTTAADPALIAAEAAELVVTAYTVADFARFNPRNALDMVNRVPGFTIRGEDGQRGLGQATANVLIDGARVSSKSENLFDRLRRLSTDRVERIEIVDGATLGIPGLSGQVANVITKPGGVSGRFEYRASMRPRYAPPSYVGGEVSLSGSRPGLGGNLEWSLAYGHGTGRGGAGGPRATIEDATGTITENRDVRLFFRGEFPRLSGRVGWTGPDGVAANLNAVYGRHYERFSDDELRDLVTGPDLFRNFDNRDRGYNYEVGGDLTLPLAGGSLKLVGQERFNHNFGRADSVLDFANGDPDAGSRFTATTRSGERIGRAEYSWTMLGGGWQVDGEAAFNRLRQSAALFVLTPSGSLDPVPFPDATGGVTEDRYEVIASHNRQLATGFTLQASGGAEFSTLAQTGANGLTRRFQRPKGSLSLAWTPHQGTDLSLKVARTVGQLSFGDFLASVSLARDNENAGNVQLVPPQSWEADLELSESLGPWGSTRLKLYGRRIEDLIEIIPVAGGLETNGNVPRASILGLEWTSTLELARIGFNGARLESTVNHNTSRLRDPLTGERRQISGDNDTYIEVSLRHDVPGSQWAWGLGAQYNHNRPFYRTGEVSKDWEGPVYTFGFIEHKNVLGMTANLNVFNLTNGRALYYRNVFAGYRDRSPLLFTERRNLGVQPIVQFSLKGDF
ncbi:TonB-dependent receptor plug domain-containing protein [Alteraurantiacibacter buctensis]|uniref:TonB-dependent receptor plug domain-containing protein n=1 Tax=Alteraurantiacibacter buctensis TaxID=1503981 RepID=A0A844YY94_9SPHN|nr:TonB-dependent receptor plug domain-containing protein [Alteraurantiacibacter buctensis]MXO73305.1 TonB-dependent receptor plug domain-containing protein [Alteraurantiacibacter buctensis]